MLFSLCAITAFSQQSSVEGTVRDTTENKTLQYAVVSLLRGSDSVLVQFTRTNKDGSFKIDPLPAGNYVLLITYPKFADYADLIQISGQSPLKLGTIPLTPASVLMREVIVRANNTMRIRGDTTEFTADSFKVREGATVEELLQQIPGMTVNSKGEITAQGKRVDRVLIDGEEFFGDDPTIATQNIGAKAVDKVQVFDSKSEQDQLKGIGASGNTGKTINIKLKENAKRGYFGKAGVNSNLNDLNDARLMLNRFVGPQKISIYGTKSNTNTGSLGWEERNKLGIEDDDYEFDEISGFYYSYGDGDDEFSNYNLRGLPNAYTAGGLFSDKWSADKHKLNLSYLYNRLGTTNNGSTLSQTLLEDTTFFNSSRSRSKGLSQQHSARGKYEWKIDSLASIRFSVAGILREKNQETESYSNAQNEDTLFVNENDRTNELFSRKKQMDNVLYYKQLFKKKNRQLSATLRMGLVEDEGNELLISDTRFYTDGNLDSIDIIDQQKINEGRSTTWGVRLQYNEPITDKWNLVTEYSLNHNQSESFRNSFDKDGDDKYSVRNLSFSNNFELNALSNSGSVTARYMGKKWRLAAGAGLSSIRLNLNNLDLANRTRYNFTGFTPQVQVAHLKSQQSMMSVNYRGNTIQPNLNQLQPLQNNNDPLSIYIGNPDLKVGFNHNINFNLHDFKVLSGRYMFVNAGISFIQNAITQTSEVDQFGKRTYKPVNVDGNYNWYLWSAVNSGQGEKKWTHEIAPSANGGRNVNFINGNRNENNYATLSLNYSLSYRVQDKFNFRFGPSLSRTLSKSSLRPNVNNNYWTYGGRANFWVKLPGKLELQSDVQANLQQKTEAFPNPVNITVWNARLTRKFLKDNALEAGIIANDILNQNIGFNRTINSSFVNEQRYDRVAQYFQIMLLWNFNKMPGSK